MVKDSIADFITQLKNAGPVGKEEIVFPYSKLVHATAELLVKEGYLVSVEKKGKKAKKLLEVKLVSADSHMPKISGVRRISKLSRRVYEKAKNLKTLRRGLGVIVLSTPKGLMTDKEAIKEKIGGEVLFKIW